MDHRSDEERDSWLRGGRSVTWTQPITQDVEQTVKGVHEDLESLGTCCQSTSLSLTVRTANSLSFKPQYFIDDTSRRFLETVVGVTPEEFALQFEAFSLGNTTQESPRDNNGWKRKVVIKADIRRILRNSLREITGDPKAEMRYIHYQKVIVEKYRVKLDNWPADGFNFEYMNLNTLTTIWSALTTGACAWRKLTAEEIAEGLVVRSGARTEPELEPTDELPPPKRARMALADKGKGKKSERVAHLTVTIPSSLTAPSGPESSLPTPTSSVASSPVLTRVPSPQRIARWDSIHRPFQPAH